MREINQNKLISKNLQSFADHLLTVISKITGCVTISDFASLIDVPTGITNSGIELKICAITAQVKK